MANNRLTQLAQEFRTLKDRKESLEGELKEVDEALKKLTTETLPKCMDDSEVEKFTVEGVGTIFTQIKVYAYVKKENEEKFHEWLRENGHGDLIKSYVFPATLSSFAKEQLEAGAELPDFMPAAKIETAMLRRR
jgi:hypothetical protein